MDDVHGYRLWLLVPLVVLGACGGTEPEFQPQPGDPPELDDADLRVVYVGNSLTYTHNVPGLVQAMAEVDGRSMAHLVFANPSWSLEEHWNAGLPGYLLDLEADVVVMQQGPSSLEQNQQHLAYWSGQFANVIRQAGGEPAIYMVWPPRVRDFAFPDVFRSYHNAAVTVNGLFMPAGQTWVEGWKLDETLPFYGPDGFHQAPLGALAAAQTIYAVLYDLPADSVPDLEFEGIEPETQDVLRQALAASLRASPPPRQE